MASEWAKQQCGCGHCHGGLSEKLNCWADALDEAHRAGQEEMRDRAANQCAEMVSRGDYGLDRERTVNKLQWFIGNLIVLSGQEETGG